MKTKFMRFTAQAVIVVLAAALMAGFAPGFVRPAHADPGNKSILSFSFASPPAVGVISGNNITVMVPYGTNVTALVPTIVHNGVSVSPDSGVAQNFTNPVTYTVTAADSTTQNYLVSVVIPITVTANAGQSKVFGSPDPVFTYTASDPVTFTGALSRAAGESVGNYAIQQGTLTAVGSNYSIIFVSNPFSITPKPITVTPTAGQSKAFGAPDPAFTYASSDPAATFTGALSRAAGENVGTYAFNLGTLSAGSNYTLSLAPENFSITPKPITVTPTAGQSKTFGAPDPVFTYASSDPAATFTGALSRAPGENAGTYNFTLGTLSAGSNYSLGLAAETFAILPGASKDITSFSFTNPAAAGVISGTNISVTAPYGTNVTALVATFTTSGESVKVGGVTQVSGTTPNDFTNPVVYTVTAADGSTKDYTVTVTAAPNPAKDITAFGFVSPAATGVISGTNIAVPLPYGTDVTALVAVFTTSGASVKVGSTAQVSGTTPNNFTNPVVYTVTAADGSTKDYTVTVTFFASPAKEITDFRFAAQTAVGVIDGSNILVTVPNGTDLSALVASFTTSGASVKVGGVAQISGTTVNNFTAPLTYTVTAADGSTKDYTVRVVIAPSSDKDITDFRFVNPNAAGVINGTNISVVVPYGTDIAALAAHFTTSGSSVKIGSTPQISGATVNNFTNPLTYTVAAEDGSTKDYSVTVTVAPNPSNKDITAFGFENLAVAGTIKGENISVTVPSGTDLTNLAATFKTTGVSVKVGNVEQVSGVTVNNFSYAHRNPIPYTVTAEDGSQKTYWVTVTAAAKTSREITSFGFNDPAVKGVISGSNIEVKVPYGTNLSALTANFTTTGVSVKVGKTEQISGVTVNSFAKPLTYVVTAADKSTRSYTVKVTVVAKEITSFFFKDPRATGVIQGNEILVTVPHGTNVKALAAYFTTTGVSVKVNSKKQVSGTTVNDFSKPVTYVVTAADNSTRAYTVKVVIARKIVTEKIRSNGLRDGWTLETSEYANAGGTSASDTALRAGDDGADRQYRSVLHFPTYYLPDNAVVTKALLMIQRRNIVGNDPFSTHGALLVDISRGAFLDATLAQPLLPQTFESPADMTAAGIIQNNPDQDWYWTLLDEKALRYINLVGITQLRLGFELDDDDDLEEDFIAFYSGDKIPLTNRPYLLIDYYTP
ncbi:MAG: hypothetical protein LDL51_06965 [Chloroflexi bacterium]|nr:hypothetical protein [Chloroflexota bacterium]